jgi:hypothetical protein
MSTEKSTCISLLLLWRTPLFNHQLRHRFARARNQQIKIQEARNPDCRIQGILFPTILPVVPQKNINLSDLNWMKHRSTSPPAWASQHHSAYTFAKIFTPNFANKIRLAYSETSHVFPADYLDFKRTIEIRTHLELRSANEKNGEQIIKISETRSGFHLQDRTSMCIYIHRRTLYSHLELSPYSN